MLSIRSDDHHAERNAMSKKDKTATAKLKKSANVALDNEQVDLSSSYVLLYLASHFNIYCDFCLSVLQNQTLPYQNKGWQGFVTNIKL